VSTGIHSGGLRMSVSTDLQMKHTQTQWGGFHKDERVVTVGLKSTLTEISSDELIVPWPTIQMDPCYATGRGE
jgi:hypothetical protein